MTLYIFAKAAERWIALQPVCEYLGLDFERETYLLQADNYFEKHISTKSFSMHGEGNAVHLGLNEQGFTAWIFQKQNADKYAAPYKPVWDCYFRIYDYLRGQEQEFIELLKKWREVHEAKGMGIRRKKDEILDAYASFDKIKTMVI